jgi:large subunit ribosomal protein L24
MMRIKKNDLVIVLTGKDKKKQGKVIEVDNSSNKVKVEGIALLTKHVKARKQNEFSAIKKVESFIDLSNVMLVSPIDLKPTRVNYKILDDGRKVRICNRTKEVID